MIPSAVTGPWPAWKAALALRRPALRSEFALAVLLAGYLAAHLGLRLLEGECLRWDEAEQTLFTQQLALGYNDQPPVYSWLLASLFRVTGVSLTGVYLFKAVILGAIYVGAYLMARRLSPARFATPAAMALLLTPYFGWSALIDGAHTLFVTTVVPFAALLALRVFARPTAWGHILLGLVLGFGVMAKYSFALLAVALPAAMLTLPAYRARLRDPRLLLTVAVGLLVVLPHAAWVADHWALVRERPMKRGGFAADLALAARVWSGLDSLGQTALLTLGPMIGVLAVCFPANCWRVLRRPAKSDETRLLGRWLVVVGCSLLLLVLLGVTRFRTHWLIPAAVLLPVYLFARLAEAPPRRGRIAFLTAAAVAAIAVFGVRLGGISSKAREGGKYWAQDRMHAALADEAEAAGLVEGFVVGDHPITCANLRRRFPGARVACVYYPAFQPTEPVGAELVVVWDASYEAGIHPHVLNWLAARDLANRVDMSAASYIESPGDPGNGPWRLGFLRLRVPRQ